MIPGTSVFLLFIYLFFPLRTWGASHYEAFSVLRVENKPAPEFSLASVNRRNVSLSDYRGKAVLLGFFKTF
jgi:hypothetical protein